MPLIGRALGVCPFIGDPVVHTCETRRRRIADPTDLYGRRAAREDGQPVVRRMPRKIDENVDAVGTNPVEEFGIGGADSIAPDLRHGLEPCCHVVAAQQI